MNVMTHDLPPDVRRCDRRDHRTISPDADKSVKTPALAGSLIR